MANIVRIRQFGAPEGLSIDDIDLGEPQAGEVKLAVKAIGLNRADALLRQNRYIETPTLPSRLSYDAAAEVIAVGEGVANVAVGDRVMTIPAFSQADYGVCGEEAIVPAHALWPWPEALSAAEAACVGVQYATAFFALSTIGELGAGDAVLLTAATGGVGFAAIEVAKALGATAIATTRKRSKADALLDAGADYAIVTSEEDLVTRVLDITDHRGVKLVFDAIAGQTIPSLMECLQPLGRCIVYGILDATDPVLPLLAMLAKGISLHTYSVFAFTGLPKLDLSPQPEAVAAAREFLVPRLADGRLKPRISETFPLSEAIAAHHALESNQQTGKIVLTVSD
ncbi:MAG: zinc-dependent alcohol dehydrogenase family protein [Cyanobacteria bacterium J06639_1]